MKRETEMVVWATGCEIAGLCFLKTGCIIRTFKECLHDPKRQDSREKGEKALYCKFIGFAPFDE